LPANFVFTAVAPTVVQLADAATITVDASQGNDFRVTLGGNRALALANGADGQVVTFLLTQDATGGRTVTWGSMFSFGSGSAPGLSTAAGASDLIAFKWVAAKGKALFMGSQTGF
jgi:hypothetical protein